MSLRLSSCLVFGLLLFSSYSVAQNTLTVAAAADLTDLETALGSSFAQFSHGSRLRFVTASSSVLAQQIENGAPYDVFLSANAQFVDRLALFRKIRPSSVRVYAIGRLAVLWRDGKQHPLKDLAENWVRFVALPNPQLAPYGVAAEDSIRHAGIWDSVRPKIVYGENVRQTLQLFDSGNTDAVLTSDSLVRSRNAQVVPDDWHSPITQKCGIVAATPNGPLAERFLAFLGSAQAQEILARFGFSSAALPSRDRKEAVRP